MTTTTKDIDRAGAYSRPAARFDDDGSLEIRASAVGNCRRALWYEATGHEPTNSPSEESLTVTEAGNALEPVVLRAMERAGWDVRPNDPLDPKRVTVDIGTDLVTGREPAPHLMRGPGIKVTGHPDAIGRLGDGDLMMVEVKTRGPEAFKRWQTLGAERSHPDSVAQAGFYSLGVFHGPRDVAIATMDTGSRTWDYEVIPAERVEQARQDACERIGALATHYHRYGDDPDALPERDFPIGHWRCRSCPFLAKCSRGRESDMFADPSTSSGQAQAEVEAVPVSDEDARDAVTAYAEAQAAMKEPEKAKRAALDTLKAWMRRYGDSKAMVDGRTVSLVTSKRYSVNYRKLNALLAPDVRAGIVTESESEYVRVG